MIQSPIQRSRNWLCLDCGKDTFVNNEDYYMLRNRLWRQLVSREQRHGMLCRACVAVRLGRPLTPADFRTGEADDGPDPEDRPMQPEDYGLIEALTPEMLQAIDSAIIEFLSARPRRVINVVGHILDESSAAIPGLPDWFYFDRVGELIDRGQLQLVREGEEFRFDWVQAAIGSTSVE
jgi:Protein of unknown function